LFALTPHILSNLEKTLGRGLVEDLEFRTVPRRREAMVARVAVPALLADDADAIAATTRAVQASFPRTTSGQTRRRKRRTV
jgi:hypothetical protein